MNRRVIVHIGWPKTATTSLQRQLLLRWPNLAGRPWSRPGGDASRTLLKQLTTGTLEAAALDEHLEASSHDRALPVMLSHEGLTGMRRWQHGDHRTDATDMAAAFSRATTWPVHVVIVASATPPRVVRSHYLYAVRGGYTRTYTDFLGEERSAYENGTSRLAIRRVVTAWEREFGRPNVTIAFMEQVVTDPVGFWTDLAADTETPEVARIGETPFEHHNTTLLGPLRWELGLNRLLQSKSDRRRAPYTHRVRRLYTRRLAPHLPRTSAADLVGTSAERSIVEPMNIDLDWVCERYGLVRPISRFGTTTNHHGKPEARR